MIYVVVVIVVDTHITNVIDIDVVVVDGWFQMRALRYNCKPLSLVW